MDHFSFQAVILSGYVQHRDVDGTERSAPVQEAGVGQSRNGRVQVASFIPQNNADSIHLTKTIQVGFALLEELVHFASET